MGFHVACIFALKRYFHARVLQNPTVPSWLGIKFTMNVLTMKYLDSRSCED
jgi:hypothetical protein